ncbi:aminopeptidase [Wenxinia marina]|uniref:Aminopeptidase T n=1 Tax=Wenxinia marina DSM 24838 TaxID=1123501 RepID=A0A0D0NRE7_9RHOB|nr:aminopeptidase [Wenxinia marina]KIQ70780.1 aminopeptidase T [Wenxinia marina DSM 24838]GGL80201.1 aminopeptidase [Wenxinia marina]
MDPAVADLTPDPQMLDRLAEVAVKVGLNLQPGQDLVLTAPTGALPLVRRVAAAAYRAGAGLVTPILADEGVTLARYRNAADESFDRAPGWLYKGMAEAFAGGAARMAISGDNPMLLSGEDAAKVARAGKANSLAYKPAMKHIVEHDINWSIVAYPGTAWAKQVFPDLPDAEAVDALAKAIFAASRLNEPDPVAAWQAHNAELEARQRWLTDRQFHALRYSGPGTDFTLGLADGHAWRGGASKAKNGVVCNPNIPTEEVFTTPHARRAEGTVRASKPLAHQGSLIEGIEVRFEGGAIVEAKATKGEAVLQQLLASDEGARRLGEVALVPHSSPISQSGLLFYNTLFDENAASHIALGQCYSGCFRDTSLSEEALAAAGGNSSIIHVDWMIGSAEIDIDGLDADGTATPVMRGGEWASAV